MDEFPVATTPSPGVMGVDWEQRVDFARLREYRLGRARKMMEEFDLGALLLFETSNIRYVTATQIGYWAFNKGERYALLTRSGPPRIWDFGSAAKAHRLQLPFLYDETNSRGGNTGLQGAIGPASGLQAKAAKEIKEILTQEGLAGERIGVDMAETSVFLALQAEGLTVVDGQQAMMRAREIKSQDEIVLLTQACAMVDGVYQDIFEALKPGVRESDIVALAHYRLFEMGSEFVEAINSIAGERCSPHPHVFSDRLIRPGDQAYFDIIHVFNGYRTCYYRTFVVGPRHPGPAGRLQAGQGVDGCSDRTGETRGHDRPDRQGVAQGRGVRFRRRNGRLRAAVRARGGSGTARTSHHQPPQLPRRSDRDQRGDGLRAGDLRTGRRWSFGRPDRRGGGGHRRRTQGDHPLPLRRADGRQ
ncbi:MAG: hypothetical protein KatS3mg011_0596 [Acidimicrobiia bacterium]|nr:MAG: hypothetical protein KatS3mg011_0596 [Acidimicrobiia bacterium]